MQRSTDDQRHRNGIGIHDQHVLEPKRKELRQRQYFVDRMDWLGHRKSPGLLVA